MTLIPAEHCEKLLKMRQPRRLDIVEQLGVSESTARDYMALLRYGALGKDHVDNWIEEAQEEYLRGRDIETILVLPDAHLGHSLNDASPEYLLVREFAKELRPDRTVILGDFGDFESMSHWMDNKRASLEGVRFSEEVAVINGELDYYQKLGKVDYLEGNHEDWVNQYVEKYPNLKGTIDLPVQLHLKRRGIDWYPYVDNGTMLTIGKLYFSHGYWTGSYHAKRHLLRFGCNIIYGHTHSPQRDTQNMRMQVPHQAYGLGCLCKLNQDYMRGAPPNWIHSFAVVQVEKESGQFQVNEVNIVDKKFIYNGVVYK